MNGPVATAKTLRLSRLIAGLRSDLAGLYRRRARGATMATLVSAGTADEEIACVESNLALYESALASALRDELAALSADAGLSSISEAA